MSLTNYESRKNLFILLITTINKYYQKQLILLINVSPFSKKIIIMLITVKKVIKDN